MRKERIGLLLLLSCVIWPALGAPLLLISIDGLHPDYVTAADRHGLRIPLCARFCNRGRMRAASSASCPQ